MGLPGIHCSLNLLIDGELDMQVIACVADGEAVSLQAAELNPDVIVMDVCMPKIDGVEATRRILERTPAIRIVALSSRSDADTVNRILQAGAAAYLTKHRAFDELIQAIRAVQQDQLYLSADVAALVDARGLPAGLRRA